MRRADLDLRVLVPVCALAAVLAGSPAWAQSVPSLDANFRPALTRAGGFLSAAALQADGQVLIAGAFNAVNGVPRNGLARLKSDGSLDPGFDAGGVCCGTGTSTMDLTPPVSALAVQPDGKILVGGSFSTVGVATRKGLARLNADGTVDSSFDPGSGLSLGSTSARYRPVVKFVLQPDGKILVGGYFTAVNGVPRSGLARLNANGSVDTSFNPGSGLAIGDPTDVGLLTGLELLPNGQILIAGEFRSFNAVLRNGIARLNSDGTLDPALDPAINHWDSPPGIDGLVVQPDGQYMISGLFDVVDNESRSGLARLKPDGTVDLSYDPDVDTAGGESYTLLGLQPDGTMLAFHQFTGADGNSHRAITRLKADGTPDPAFALELLPRPGSGLQIAAVAFQGDQLLVAGNFQTDVSGAHEGIARVGNTGQVDAGFSPRFEQAEGSRANVLALAVQADDKVLVGGTFELINGAPRYQLARLNADGGVDSSFAPALAPDPQSTVSTLLVQNDGRILVGGSFSGVNGTNVTGIARLNPDGTLDRSFDVGTGTGGTGHVTALAEQPDGKILVAGDFTQLNGLAVSPLSRLNTNGAVDVTFSTDFPDCPACAAPEIHSLGVLTNGSVMVGGLFNRIESFFLNGLARLRPDGSADFSFIPPITSEESVSAMQVDADGRTTVAVSSSDASGNTNRTHFLRFNADGTPDGGFAPAEVTGDGSSAPPVSAMAQDNSGRLLITGQFSAIGGVPRRGLARLNTDGTLDTTFDAGPGFGNGVFAQSSAALPLITSVALQANGGIVVGGDFGTVNGQVRLGLARFQAGQSTPPPPTGQLTLSSPKPAADGTFSMSVSGPAGKAFTVQASTDLRTWSAVGTVNTTGTPQPFTDATAKGMAYRFYRATGQ